MTRTIKFRAWAGTLILPVENLDWAEDGLRPYINEYTWVNPNTLMQYTGLKDKNGKEIYEGDVLKIDTSHDDEGQYPTTFNQAVYFENGAFYPVCELPTDKECEVIGNIYEKPELL